MANQGWLLKILSGAHQGAEIALDAGSYTIGTDENCDLVLIDSALSDQHIRLTIDESGIFQIELLSADSSVFCNNIEQEEQFNFKSFDIIATENINFAIGGENEAWPHLTSPNTSDRKSKSSKQKKDDEQSSVEENQHVETEHADEPDMLSDVDIPILDQVIEPEATSPYDKVFKPIKNFFHKMLLPIKQFFHRIIYFYNIKNPVVMPALSITSFLVIFIFVFLWMWKMSTPGESEQNKMRANLTQSKAIIENFYIKNLSVKILPNNEVLINGYMNSSSEKKDLENALSKAKISNILRIYTVDKMVDSANKLLEKMEYKYLIVKPDANTVGSIIISGYLPKGDELGKLKLALRQEIPGLLTISEQIEYQKTRMKALHTMLKEGGLKERITVLDQYNKIVLEGRLYNISEGYHLQEVVKKFVSLYGNQPSLEINVTLPSTDLATLRPVLDIRSVSYGRMPFILMTNGDKYMIGAELQNGYILEDIGLEYLILRLGKERIKYYIGDNSNGS